MNQIEQINKTLALVKKAREGEFLNGDGHGIVPSEEYEKCGIDVKNLEQEFMDEMEEDGKSTNKLIIMDDVGYSGNLKNKNFGR